MNKVKILLVDDRNENLFALESLLENPNIEFHRANGGLRALDLLLEEEFALAIVDVQMPEMDGFELAELMRGTERTRSVPIIFVTADSHNRLNTFRGYEMGAVDFLYKPLDPHVVRSKVQIFIELAHQRQLLRVRLQETQAALLERDQALTEAREALRTRDEFMSIASHELKTPLTSLHLQLQLMGRSLRKLLKSNSTDDGGAVMSGPQVTQLDHSLKICERQSGKLATLLNELLDLTRVRLGKLELNREEMDLAGLVRDVLERFRSELQHKKIEAELLGLDTAVGQWDSNRIDQVVTNLVSNAIKYGAGQPVQLKIEAVDGGREIRLSVTDRGIGIPEDMQTKIFERFERAVSGEKISGLGLGLYITRQIVEAHGGEISVESELGKGSCFRVDLPVRAGVHA